MKIKYALIIYKRSSYSFYFRQFRNPRSSKQGHINASLRSEFIKAHHEHDKTLKEVMRCLAEKKIRFKKCRRGQRVDYRPFDFIITVGGDGTFLEAARGATKQVLIGVNSDPSRSVGRFCIANRLTFQRVLEKFLRDKIGVKTLCRMRLEFNHRLLPVDVLNDILISHKNPAAMSRYIIKLGKIKETQRSSGVWVATAAGSSGAIHSAGGTILPVQSNKIQYHPRELFKQNNAKYRLNGGVVASGRPLVFCSLMRGGMIFVDGAHVRLPFSFGDVATISRSSHPLRVIIA